MKNTPVRQIKTKKTNLYWGDNPKGSQYQSPVKPIEATRGPVNVNKQYNMTYNWGETEAINTQVIRKNTRVYYRN